MQGVLFNAERKDLRENKSVKRSSRIAPFSPFIGPNRLIRSAGRIKRLVEIDFGVRHPIVLDARHTFVKLLLSHTPVKRHHQGINYLRAKVQERYTISKLGSSLRSIKFNCVTCKKFWAAIIQPIMADLPVERPACQSPPFTNTGIDYFGPLYVTVRRTTEKRWGFLFTCLTTRAAHVRIVPSVCNGSGAIRQDVHLPLFGQTMALTLLGRKKNYARISRSGTPSTSPSSLPTKALIGCSIRPVGHTMVASGRVWYVVLSEYFTPSSVLVVSRTKFWILLFVSLNKNLTHDR